MLLGSLISCQDRKDHKADVYGQKSIALRLHLNEGKKIASPGSAVVFYKDVLNAPDSFAHYPTYSLTILYNRLTNAFISLNDCSQALEYALLAVEASNKLRHGPKADSTNLDNSYYNLAKSYRLCEDWRKYKAYLDSALIYARDEQMQALVYHGFADHFIYNRSSDSSIYYNGKAKNVYLKLGDTAEAAWADLNLVGLYYQQKEYQHGVELAGGVIDIQNKFGVPRAYSYSLLGQGLIHLEDYDKAKAYLDTAALLAQREGSNEEQKEVLIHYVDLYRNTQDFEALVFFYDSLMRLNSKILNEEQIAKAKALEENFLIKTQKERIEQLNLKQEVTQSKLVFRTTAAILVTVVGIIVLALVYQHWQLQRQKEQTQRIAVEQKLFGAQINPHFIFNALSAIQAEVLNQNTKKANRYLTRFGRLLQSILASTTQEYISISNEYKNLVNYLELQKLRFENFEYEVVCYEGIEDDEALLPPMLIQPLLENAVEHGWKELNKGIVKLSITKEERSITCTVLDGGAGLRSGNGRNDKISVSTGLIHKRLAYLSRKHKMLASLSIRDRKESSGVEAIIVLPLINAF